MATQSEKMRSISKEEVAQVSSGPDRNGAHEGGDRSPRRGRTGLSDRNPRRQSEQSPEHVLTGV